MRIDEEAGLPEIWKPVVGYEGQYEVSSLGRVRSLPRDTPYREYSRRHPGGLLSTSLPRGHRYASVTLAGKGHYVHRLVCEAFHGTPEKEKPWACHANDNPEDNRAENLYWGSPNENISDSFKNGGREYVTKCPRGHEYSEENTYWYTKKSGTSFRTCRTCKREINRKAQRSGRAKEKESN